ncbi:flagellar biosynthesis protein FlhB [Clostridium aminobutyricum]|uniref:Flagellar biosynthetic protein FlhB n=1 Tax=Clostridium aminobutyricum TaxID=33953 RepID=A0A939IGR2_CLOAM|nr:flagellar biosynthesis protein FlhB [Clostridium aminobutyricum]MBN7773755.1 flagellar biosynthesis protein FlhB [Clostridium aminobutyricum]
MSQSKTEKATPKKRKDERKKGNIASSKDIVSVVSLLVVFSVLKIMLPYIYAGLDNFFIYILGQTGKVDTVDYHVLAGIQLETLKLLAIVVLPILLIASLTAIVATGFQTRFLFSTEALKPKFSRLNPLQGFKRMFSLKSAVELIKGIIKILIICVVLYKFFISRIYNLIRTLYLGIPQSVAYILDSIVMMVYMVCIIFIFVAGLDYIYQRWDHERQMKMSKHEIKEEYKQMEGDPQIKGKIKQKQRQMAMSRMMQSVPTADVVIKNPTHFAVALRYHPDSDRAPIVVAKGQDELALRIIAVAENAGVLVIEDKPLARAIYATAEVKMEIPYAYYTAVAEIFALVYSTKENKNKPKRN